MDRSHSTEKAEREYDTTCANDILQEDVGKAPSAKSQIRTDGDFLGDVIDHIQIMHRQVSLHWRQEVDNLQREILQIRSRLHLGNAIFTPPIQPKHSWLDEDSDTPDKTAAHIQSMALTIPSSSVGEFPESPAPIASTQEINESDFEAVMTLQSDIVPLVASDCLGTSLPGIVPSSPLSSPVRKDEGSTWCAQPSVATNNTGKRTIATSKSGLSTSSNMFPNAEDMKRAVREALIRDDTRVDRLWRDDGTCQKIVRSQFFEVVTLAVISLNTVWIAIDTDLNTASSLDETNPSFVIIDVLFALFFFGEWSIRFTALRNKLDLFKDNWFILDSVLVILMVFDLAVLFGTSGAANSEGRARNTSLLKILRLTRLTRMARIAFLLRAIPEVAILLKGILVAARSVFFTLCLLAILIYIFSIAFRQLSDGTEVGDRYFESVPSSMKSLLVYGTLPDQADLIDSVSAEHALYGVLLLIFILCASLTVMNMLVGVLVEVVSVVSAVEKEQMRVIAVKSKLRKLMKGFGWTIDEGLKITRDEFKDLICVPDAAKAIEEVGVDPVGLVDFADFIFKDAPESGISFPEFIEVVLELRGSNACTVKDIVDLRKFLFNEMARIEQLLRTQGSVIRRILSTSKQQHVKFRPSIASAMDEAAQNTVSEEIMARQLKMFGSSGNSNRDISSSAEAPQLSKSSPQLSKARNMRSFIKPVGRF